MSAAAFNLGMLNSWTKETPDETAKRILHMAREIIELRTRIANIGGNQIKDPISPFFAEATNKSMKSMMYYLHLIPCTLLANRSIFKVRSTGHQMSDAGFTGARKPNFGP